MCNCSLVPRLISQAFIACNIISQVFIACILQAVKAWEISLGTRLYSATVHVN